MRLSFDQFDLVISTIESGNNPWAWGDDGHAMGRRQMHPAFIAQWYPSSRWTLGMMWDDVGYGAISAFYHAAVADGVRDVEAAVGFHLHGQPRSNEAAAPGYARRFTEAAAKLGYEL